MTESEALPPASRRFVILAHEEPDGSLHYDLMLQAPGEQLWTWSFARPPGGEEASCQRLFDHPDRFLTYEGPLREGRGRVQRYDIGSCLVTGDPADTLLLSLRGRKVTGTFRLRVASEAQKPTDKRGYLWQPLE